MVEEDYEIVSRKEIDRLKHEIKDLREGKDSASASNIMGKLNQMLELFKDASINIKEDMPLGKKIDVMNEKLEKLLDQNHKIAEGMITVAEMLSGEKPKGQQPQSTPKQAIPSKEPQQYPQMPHPGIPPQFPGQAHQQHPQMPPHQLHPMHPQPGFQQPMPQRQAPRPSTPESFPKPAMPSFNPMEGPKPELEGSSLPSKPPKKKIFGRF